jgi:hypothetical protein
MKKVSKKVQITKSNEEKYFSLNGDMLKKIRGGAGSTVTATEDRNCGGSGCGATANYNITGACF